MASGSVTAPVETPAPSRRPAALKAPSDPGLAALRRAARAAIVIPPAFAFGQLLLHDSQNVIFIVFGGFALLVMSDFGGLRVPQRRQGGRGAWTRRRRSGSAAAAGGGPSGRGHGATGRWRYREALGGADPA